MTKKINIIKEFYKTGVCVLALPIVYKNWDKSYFLSQWHEEFRLVKDDIKITISKGQAFSIIKKLKLTSTESDAFKHAYTWRLEKPNL